MMPATAQPVGDSGRSSSQHARKYDAAAVALVVVFFGLLAAIRSHLPVVSDSWYHLGVIRAFFERGPSLHDWWEFAPYGRPHCYSPLFHLLFVGILHVTNLNLVQLAQLDAVVTFPLLLLAGWGAARLLFGSRAAFVTLLLLALNIGLLFPCSLVMMPATDALLLWPFVQILLIRRHWWGSGLLLAVMCYFHLGMGSVALLAVVIFVLCKREYWSTALPACLLAVLCFSPWLLHLYRQREFLHSGAAPLAIFSPVFVLVAGLLGIVAVGKRPEKEALAVLAMLAASLLFWFTVRERFWTCSGFLCALLGGYGLERWLGRQLRWVTAVLVVSCISVTPFLKPAHMRLGLPVVCQSTPGLMGTPLLTLVQWQRADRAKEIPAAVPADIAALAKWIMANVAKDEILVIDTRHLGPYLFALTGRRTTSGGWGEVMSEELGQKINEYIHSGPGYVILFNAENPPAQLDQRTVFATAIGRFAVYRRAQL